MKGYTTIEQSKKLLELGLDPNTADMCWCNNSIKGVNYTDIYEVHTHTVEEVKNVFDGAFNEWDRFWKLIPCWSIAALFELMPSDIIRCDNIMFLTLEKAGAYNLYYKSHNRLDEIWFTKENVIDAAFEMVVWLLENKYIQSTNKE